MTVLVLAATSKVPFYIAGLLFALWAVVLSAIGLNRPEFPNNLRGQRLVVLITAVLMVFALATAILTA